ncbi:MAG: trigger factor [Bacteroidia bacterium]|nr:trigger factor [Bacteroidia bacterium]
MDITLAPKEGLIDTLTVTLEPADYQADYEASLKDYRKKVQLPGFRPGTVPASLIRKRFGQSILAEKVNQQVAKALGDYLENSTLNILGRPYLTQTSFQELNPEGTDTLAFTFEVGKMPEIALNLSDLPSVEAFEVTVTEADLDRQIERLRVQHSHGHEAQTVEIGQDYALQGILQSAPRVKLALTPDAPEEVEYDYRRGLTLFTALVPALKPHVVGKQVGETVEFVPSRFFPDDIEGAMQLRVSVAQYHELAHQPLQYEIRALRTAPLHELNPEFYAHIFPEAEVADEAQFRAALRQKLEAEATNLSQLYLNYHLKRVLLERHPFELPDRILQAFFYEESEAAKNPEANFAQQYAQYREEMKLHLLRRKLQEQYPQLELTDEQFKDAVRDRLKAMFPASSPEAQATPEGETEAPAQDAPELPAENPMLDLLMAQVLGNEQFAQREYQNLANARFYEVVAREVVPVVRKTATYTEFERYVATEGA